MDHWATSGQCGGGGGDTGVALGLQQAQPVTKAGDSHSGALLT
jgi:hypothetical protein